MDRALKHRLFVHAGLRVEEIDLDYCGFLASVERLMSTGGSPQQMWDDVYDLLALLVEWNREINGDQPEATPGACKSQSLDRLVVYALVGMSHLAQSALLGSSDPRNSVAAAEVARASWVIIDAMMAVLAGDFDDVVGSVVNEAITRQIPLDDQWERLEAFRAVQRGSEPDGGGQGPKQAG